MIIANIEPNIPIPAPFTSPATISCCADILSDCNTSFAILFETVISQSYKIGNDTAVIIALAK